MVIVNVELYGMRYNEIRIFQGKTMFNFFIKRQIIILIIYEFTI